MDTKKRSITFVFLISLFISTKCSTNDPDCFEITSENSTLVENQSYRYMFGIFCKFGGLTDATNSPTYQMREKENDGDDKHSFLFKTGNNLTVQSSKQGELYIHRYILFII